MAVDVSNDVALRHALTALSPRYRAVVTLAAIGHSTDEIVTILGLPTPNSARVLLFRARQALRQVYLEPEAAGDINARDVASANSTR